MSNDPNPKKMYGDRKIKLQIVPAAVEIAIANGLQEGAEKYGPFNWRDDPVEAQTYVGAIRRHLAAWIEGEDVDPDSPYGKRHLEGAIASLAILIDAEAAGTLIDNRWGKIKKPAKTVLEALKKGAREDSACWLETSGDALLPALTSLVSPDRPVPEGPLDPDVDYFVEITSDPGVEDSNEEEAVLDSAADEAEVRTKVPDDLQADWDEAPEWANWWAMDRNGTTWWYEDEPKRGNTIWFRTPGTRMLIDWQERCGSLPVEDWQGRLETRPQAEEKPVSDVPLVQRPDFDPAFVKNLVNWDEAPEWANWWCCDSSGNAWWTVDEPIEGDDDEWTGAFYGHEFTCAKDVDSMGVHWSQLKVKRPEAPEGGE